jgi:hypothetical protein
MPAYDSNKPQQSLINFFDLAGLTTHLFEQEPLNVVDSIDAILSETEEPLEAYFWYELHAVSPWNSYWAEAARNGGGLEINDPVVMILWIKYYRLYVDCQDEELCYCEHNCGGTHTTVGSAAEAQSTKSESTIKAIQRDTESQILWTDYNKRKANNGMVIDRELFPAPLPTLLIIVTTPSKHEVFFW